MSRVGKKPVAIPKGVTAKVEGQKVSAKGPKGELHFTVPDIVEVKQEGEEIRVDPRDKSNRGRAMWGMSRAMINNIVTGVSEGFERKLEINGVGYRAAVAGKNLQLSLGYSHDITYPIPDGITITTPRPTEIIIVGHDKRNVGQVAAEIRGMRPPEPYKG